MQLIVISSEKQVGDEGFIINELFKAGMPCFHLRKPAGSIKQVQTLIDQIDSSYHNRIVLHQYHELAGSYGLKYLHYTELARKQSLPGSIASIIEKGFSLSTSVHDTGEISSLTGFAYTFFSPVFDSLSKPGYQSIIKSNFQLINKPIALKVIALGGVDVHRLKNVWQMGFDGAAVLGAIWNNPQMALPTFERLQTVINKLKNHHDR